MLRTVVTQTVGLFDKPVRLATRASTIEFYERRKFSSGAAHFYTHEDIERMDAKDFMDMLRRVPHLQIWEESGNTMIRFPHCSMDGIMIELDGNRIWPIGSAVQRDVGLGIRRRSRSDGSRPRLAGWAARIPSTCCDRYGKRTSRRSRSIRPLHRLPVDAVGTSCAAIFVWTR